MYSDKNDITFNYRSRLDDSHETDMNVNFECENTDESKLRKILNKWLIAIEADLEVVEK